MNEEEESEQSERRGVRTTKRRSQNRGVRTEGLKRRSQNRGGGVRTEEESE